MLACLPGLDEAKAQQIVAARQGKLEPEASLTWLVDAVGEESALAAAPSLTASTYQVTADIAAVGRQGRGYRRSEVVIDLSETEPQIRYRRDLHPFGWSLGAEIFDELELMRSQQR